MTRRLAAIAALVVAALSYNLAGYPLLDPDEGRNAEVAREMAATGDYLHPRLNGLPYVDKPVLFFAVTAVFVKVFGATEAAARIPPLLFTLGTLTLVWWTGRRWFGKDAGWIAAIAAGASPLALGFAHTVIMDSAVTLFVTLAIVAFVEGLERDGWWISVGWVGLALGVLTKGPIALALPLMVVLPYAIWQKRARALVDTIGILAFLAILLPWLKTMSDAAPGYFHHALVTETWLRLTTPALERTGPWWYFVPILIAGTLPWSIVVLTAGWDLVRRIGGSADRRMVLLFLWILVPLLFFSLSQSKRPQYVLPLTVPIALLAASLLSRSFDPSIRRSVDPALAAAVLASTGITLILARAPLLSTISTISPPVLEAAQWTAILLGAICVTCGSAAWVWGKRLDVAMLALSLPLASIPFVSRTLLREIGRDRSAIELAQGIQQSVPSDTEIVGVGAFPPSLPFYLRHTVTLATADGRELTSNYIIRSVDTWRRIPGSTLRPADWWRQAFNECERPRVFVVRATDSAARGLLSGSLSPLAETRKYVAYGPCGRVDLADGRMGGWTDGRMDGWTDSDLSDHPTIQLSVYPSIRLSVRP